MSELLLTTFNKDICYHFINSEEFDKASIIFNEHNEIIGASNTINSKCGKVLSFNENDNNIYINKLITEDEYLKCKMHLLCKECFDPVTMCLFLYEGYKYSDEKGEPIDQFYTLIRKSSKISEDTKKVDHLNLMINDIYNTSSKILKCPICFEEIEKGNINILSCGHYFDKKCLEHSMEHKLYCPICRNII